MLVNQSYPKRLDRSSFGFKFGTSNVAGIPAPGNVESGAPCASAERRAFIGEVAIEFPESAVEGCSLNDGFPSAISRTRLNGSAAR